MLFDLAAKEKRTFLSEKTALQKMPQSMACSSKSGRFLFVGAELQRTRLKNRLGRAVL